MSEHIRAVRASVYSLSSVCVSINIFHGAMITFIVRCRQSTVGPPHISHARCDTVIKVYASCSTRSPVATRGAAKDRNALADSDDDVRRIHDRHPDRRR